MRWTWCSRYREAAGMAPREMRRSVLRLGGSRSLIHIVWIDGLGELGGGWGTDRTV